MPIIHLRLSLLIIQQTKVRPSASKGVVPLPVSCDNKLRLTLLQDMVLPGLWSHEEMVRRLYLFSQLELVLVCGYLLVFQACGENVTFMKGMLIFQIIKYRKSFVLGCLLCGFQACLSWWAFPFCFTALAGLPFPPSPAARHKSSSTVPAVQCCFPHQSLQIWPGNLSILYLKGEEWELGAEAAFWLDVRDCGVLRVGGHLLALGFRFAVCLQVVFLNHGENWAVTAR